MQGSGEAYQQLILRIAEILPDVATQVRDEVARGRIVAGTKLSTADREERETRMLAANAGKIGKTDVATVDYTDDERLALLVESLIRTAFTMRSSRRAIAELRNEMATGQIVFESPDGTERLLIPISDELSLLNEIATTVIELLAPALAELEGVTWTASS